jgi:hypothetical protein
MLFTKTVTALAPVILLASAVFGQERITVVSAPGAAAVEILAAQELSRYLQRLYPGQSFPIGSALPTAGPAILVGTPHSQPELRRLVAAERLGQPESFVVSAPLRGKQRIGVVAGADERGTLYGVYALLEKLGCGFYLSYEALPIGRKGPFTFDGWELADAPVAADRIVFDWHNFLSSASSWELADWQRYIDQAAKMRFNTIMVHAYGNNPMFQFRYNGETKPIGYLATTARGRDWGTQHVNDVRRIIGGEIFKQPVFGASIATVPEEQRSEAATDLTKKVLAHARSRGMHVTFALDVDTESANPQNIIKTLPASARISKGTLDLANPDTPEGYAYYKAQVQQLLQTYPQIDRLAVWFRLGRTPWRDLTPKDFPPEWRKQFESALQSDPELSQDKGAAGIFAISKLVRAFGKALRDLGRPDVQLATGSWQMEFVRTADRLMPREAAIIPLDWKTIFETEAGQAQLRGLNPARKLIPIVWAHHDDRTYVGRSYTPFANFASLLKQSGSSGFGIIHWTTRPLDLYFKSLALQVWRATENQPAGTACEEMAARSFGESARATGGAYLLRWVNEAPMFGRETRDQFMDVPLKEPDAAIEKIQSRLALLDRIDSGMPEGRERLAYYRDYEQFMLAFFTSHRALERAQEMAGRGDHVAARQELAKCNPEDVINRYAQAARHGAISRGEQALLVSLNLRWLPYVVSARQTLGAETVRIKFGPTQHEPLAQSPGTNTFYFDAGRNVWKVMGEKETGAPAFELSDGALDEIARTGLRVEKPLTLSLGPIMGGKLEPGAYRIRLFLTKHPGGGDIEVELRGSPDGKPVKDAVDGAYAVQITGGAMELTLRPVRGTALVSGVLLTPVSQDH